MALRIDGLGGTTPAVYSTEPAVRVQQLAQSLQSAPGTPRLDRASVAADRRSTGTPHGGHSGDGSARRRVAVETYARFVLDDTTNRLQIKIINARTGEVLAAIPPDELLRLAEELQRYQGLLLEATK
jgi:hypothetical protein